MAENKISIRKEVSKKCALPLSYIHNKIITPYRAWKVRNNCKVHADFEKAFIKGTPKVVAEYVHSRAGEKPFNDINSQAFENVRLNERAPDTDKLTVDMSRELLGGLIKTDLPYGFGPIGSQGSSWPMLEKIRADVAAEHNIVDIPSTFASVRMEELVTDLSGFQLYIPEGLEVGLETVRRAKAAGYKFLVLTMDTRECGIRTPSFYNKDAQFISGNHLQKAWLGKSMLFPKSWPWLINHLYSGGDISFPNIIVDGKPVENVNVGVQLNNSAITWDKIDRITEVWDGPFVIKGIATIEDVRKAKEHGASAVIISNHGGRQISQGAASLHAALQIVPQVKAEKLGLEIWMDGGVYNGNAICIAKAAGVDFVLCGRGPCYAGGYAGKAGIERWVEVINEQLRNTMLLTNFLKYDDIDQSLINQWGDPVIDIIRELKNNQLTQKLSGLNEFKL